VRKREKSCPDYESYKGPSSFGRKRKAEKELTEEERIEILRTPKVLNGSVFDLEINTKPGIRSLVDVVMIQSWTHFFTVHVLVLHES